MSNIVFSQLNWLDAAIAFIILLSILISFFRGFFREAISLATWVLAIILAIKYATPFANNFITQISSQSTRFFIAFAALFILIFICGALVGTIVRAIVNKIGVGFIDRLLGIIFGTLRGVLAVGVLLMFISVTPLQNSTWMQRSQTVSIFSPLVNWLDGFIPVEAKNVTALVGNQNNNTNNNTGS